MYFLSFEILFQISSLTNKILNITYIYFIFYMPYKISYISDIYGKPFYYLLCKIDILNVISDILYRI